MPDVGSGEPSAVWRVELGRRRDRRQIGSGNPLKEDAVAVLLALLGPAYPLRQDRPIGRESRATLPPKPLLVNPTYAVQSEGEQSDSSLAATLAIQCSPEDIITTHDVELDVSRVLQF